MQRVGDQRSINVNEGRVIQKPKRERGCGRKKKVTVDLRSRRENDVMNDLGRLSRVEYVFEFGVQEDGGQGGYRDCRVRDRPTML